MPSPPDYCTPQYLLSFLFFFEKTFVLSKLHIVLMYLQLDYIGQALDLLVSVS